MSKPPRIKLLIALVLTAVGMLACGLLSNPLSQAQGFASTAEAIASSMPSALPSGVPNLPDITKYMNPTGTPAKEWSGIPIMTQAIAGQEFSKNTYSYRVSGVTATEIQSFYNEKMAAAGWAAGFSTFVGSAGGFLVYTKGSSFLTVSVAQDNKEYVVLLVTQ